MLFILGNLFLTLTPLFGQEKRTTISFEYYTHDFGTIREEGGTVSYDFKFTNAGNVPLRIKNVTPSCGCTVPTWTQEPIGPEGQGTIKVVFDPTNKPGPFSKTLTIEANALNAPVIITIQGKVVPKPRKPQDEFPDRIGNLRMLSRYMHMGEITTEQWQRKTFELYNQSDTVVTVKNVSLPGTYLNLKVEPSSVPPLSKAKIVVDYSPKWKNDFGLVQDKVIILTDDKSEPLKTLFVTAFITLQHNMTDDERAVAPKFRIDKSIHQFGTINQGSKVSATFIITNGGKSDLHILKIKPSCGCTLVELDKKTLKEGETASLTITFDSAGKEGVQEKHVNIYTNDPDQFNVSVTLKAKISKLPQ